ncbi:MAG: shikimate kinase [Gemmatimonadaceae bacterium]|nr:shikimate kinase [Gemmatimonadaceae bacterium]
MTATFRTSQPVSPIDANKPHVVFVGLPGAGKTSVGEGVAQALGRAFLDLDREIERREGMPVSQIFGERGEHHFRKLEAQLTGELREVGGMILSPGGGWIAQPGNVELLRPPARIIYLRVRPETAIKRLGAERATRPLLVRPDPLAELRKLYEARRAAFEGADVTIDTERQTVAQVIINVVDMVRREGAA